MFAGGRLMIRDFARITIALLFLWLAYAEVAEHDAYTLQEQSQ